MHLWIPILYRIPLESLEITAYLNPYRIPTITAYLKPYRIPTDIQHLWMPTEYIQISSIFECLQNTYRYPASLNPYRIEIENVLNHLKNHTYSNLNSSRSLKSWNPYRIPIDLLHIRIYRIPPDLLNLWILTESLQIS